MQPIKVEYKSPDIGKLVHVRSGVDEEGNCQYFYAYYSGEDFFWLDGEGNSRKLWFEVEDWVFSGEGFDDGWGSPIIEN